MAPRKPLPVDMTEEIPQVPVLLDSGIAESRKKLKEIVPDALNAVEEIVNDEDHKDRYKAASDVLGEFDIVRANRENSRSDPEASANVLKAVMEIGRMFNLQNEMAEKVVSKKKPKAKKAVKIKDE